MFPSSGYKLWKKRIESGTATMAQCRNFSQAIRPKASYVEACGKKTNVTTVEANALTSLLRGNPLTLDADSTERGKNWLRKNGRTIGLPSDLIERASSFAYCGQTAYFDDGKVYAYPLWMVRDSAGTPIFTYYAVPWQARAYSHDEMPLGGFWREGQRIDAFRATILL